MKPQTSGTGLVQRIFSVGQLLSNNNVSENVFKLLQRYSGTSEISPSGAQRTMSVTQTQFSEDEPENVVKVLDDYLSFVNSNQSHVDSDTEIVKKIITETKRYKDSLAEHYVAIKDKIENYITMLQNRIQPQAELSLSDTPSTAHKRSSSEAELTPEVDAKKPRVKDDDSESEDDIEVVESKDNSGRTIITMNDGDYKIDEVVLFPCVNWNSRYFKKNTTIQNIVLVKSNLMGTTFAKGVILSNVILVCPIMGGSDGTKFLGTINEKIKIEGDKVLLKEGIFGNQPDKWCNYSNVVIATKKGCLKIKHANFVKTVFDNMQGGLFLGDINIDKSDMRKMELTSGTWKGLTISETKLEYSQFALNFNGVVFENIKGTDVTISPEIGEKTDVKLEVNDFTLRSCVIENFVFKNTKIKNLNVDECNLPGMQVENCSIEVASLRDSSFIGSRWENVIISDLDTNADFSKSTFENVDFIVSGEDSSTQFPFLGANFAGTELNGVVFSSPSGIKMNDSKLTNIYFYGCDEVVESNFASSIINMNKYALTDNGIIFIQCDFRKTKFIDRNPVEKTDLTGSTKFIDINPVEKKHLPGSTKFIDINPVEKKHLPGSTIFLASEIDELHLSDIKADEIYFTNFDQVSQGILVKIENESSDLGPKEPPFNPGYQEISIINSSFGALKFYEISLSGTIEGCDSSISMLKNTNCRNLNIKNCKLGKDSGTSTIEKVNFKECNLESTSLTGFIIKDVKLSMTNLKDLILESTLFHSKISIDNNSQIENLIFKNCEFDDDGSGAEIIIKNSSVINITIEYDKKSEIDNSVNKGKFTGTIKLIDVRVLDNLNVPVTIKFINANAIPGKIDVTNSNVKLIFAGSSFMEEENIIRDANSKVTTYIVK